MRRSSVASVLAALAASLLSACHHGRQTPSTAFAPLALPAHERTVEVPVRLEDAYVNCLVQVATEAGYQLIGFDEATKRYEMDKGFSVFLDREQNPTDVVERFHFWVMPGIPFTPASQVEGAKAVTPPLRVQLRLASYDVKTQQQVVTRANAAEDFRRIGDGCVVSSPARKTP